MMDEPLLRLPPAAVAVPPTVRSCAPEPAPLRADVERDLLLDLPVASLKRFAGASCFRSARVEELVIDDNFCRRPLRPEDIELIDWASPAIRQDLTDLRSLAVHRMLLSINEADCEAQPQWAHGERDRASFYDPQVRLLGRQLKPWLETLAFAQPVTDSIAARLRIRDSLREIKDRSRVIAHFSSVTPYEPMLVLQRLGLLRTTIHALARGMAAAMPERRIAHSFEAALQRLEGLDPQAALRRRGLSSSPHAHWQFYLPTTLASANGLFAISADGFEFCGAAAHAVLQAFAAAEEFDLAERDSSADAEEWNVSLDDQRLQAARYGPAAQAAWCRGFAAAANLRALQDADLWTQIAWLAEMNVFQDRARALDQAIRQQRLQVRQDSFIEPREMCSTTHVHDDHRLVVVERGVMTFWGSPGMVLRLLPGDMTLVPAGRLHGSSVESQECAYHQPIIPSEWLVDVLPVPPWLQRGSVA
jgi:hypothetical protein